MVDNKVQHSCDNLKKLMNKKLWRQLAIFLFDETRESNRPTFERCPRDYGRNHCPEKLDLPFDTFLSDLASMDWETKYEEVLPTIDEYVEALRVASSDTSFWPAAAQVLGVEHPDNETWQHKNRGRSTRQHVADAVVKISKPSMSGRIALTIIKECFARQVIIETWYRNSKASESSKLHETLFGALNQDIFRDKIIDQHSLEEVLTWLRLAGCEQAVREKPAWLYSAEFLWVRPRLTDNREGVASNYAIKYECKGWLSPF